jgi:hypothetical protein
MTTGCVLGLGCHATDETRNVASRLVLTVSASALTGRPRAEVAARWNFETSVRTGGTTTPRPDPLPAKPRPTKAGTAPGVLVAFPPNSDSGARSRVSRYTRACEYHIGSFDVRVTTGWPSDRRTHAAVAVCWNYDRELAAANGLRSLRRRLLRRWRRGASQSQGVSADASSIHSDQSRSSSSRPG